MNTKVIYPVEVKAASSVETHKLRIFAPITARFKAAWESWQSALNLIRFLDEDEPERW